jgi:hypothetical protein
MKSKLLLTVTMSVLLLAPFAFAQRAGQVPDTQVEKFRSTLERDGFNVTEGAVVTWNPTAEWCAYTPGVDSALYFNIEPYLQVKVPASAQEQDQLSGQFQLDPREAVVLIGLTPPPEKYFSITPYLWSRVYPDGSRKQVTATLGDSVNVATVKTVGPTPFNAPVALIFTPDQTTEAGVRAALRRSGYPAAIINTVVFPASMMNLGHSETADLLTIAVRNAIWTDPDAGSDYVSNPPLRVFRVTPRTAATANPFPAPPLRIRGTGRTEMDLANKLGELRQGIIAANTGMDAADITLIPMCYEGYDLIQRGIEWCGDSRDAFYVGAGIPEYDSINQIRLADGEFLMVYGPNHVATGKATYMNINVYASETAKLTLGAVDDGKLAGTATPYLPAGDPDADLMYVYKISRDCGNPREPNCLELSPPDGCTRLTLDSSTLLGVFIRSYLEPATKIGPAMPEMLYDRVLKFSPPSP